MNLNEYQDNALKTAVYPNHGQFAGLTYLAMKLAGESGEVNEKIAKALRDDHVVLFASSLHVSSARREAIKKELGDVLWYVAMIAWELGISLDDVGTGNNEKLKDRQERGVLRGDGDDR